MRTSFIISLLAAPVALAAIWHAADGTGAVSPQTTASIAIAPAAAAPLPEAAVSEPFVQGVARKGTRNYDPGDSDALTVPSTATDDEAVDRDPLKECMETWDAATHITKSKWREICERQIRERAEARREFEAQPPATP
jgi:hypothetical protein